MMVTQEKRLFKMLRIMEKEIKRIVINKKIIAVLTGIVMLNILSVYGELKDYPDVISVYILEITGETLFPLFSVILCM